jgi:predicted transcriptional regulator
MGLGPVNKPEASVFQKILEAIGDDKSRRLLNLIAQNEELPAVDLLTQLNFSHKEYYSRLGNLLRLGVVKRMPGRYVLTAFGRVIYQLLLILVDVIETKPNILEQNQ